LSHYVFAPASSFARQAAIFADAASRRRHCRLPSQHFIESFRAMIRFRHHCTPLSRYCHLFASACSRFITLSSEDIFIRHFQIELAVSSAAARIDLRFFDSRQLSPPFSFIARPDIS
jgi:hypothetical protein